MSATPCFRSLSAQIEQYVEAERKRVEAMDRAERMPASATAARMTAPARPPETCEQGACPIFFHNPRRVLLPAVMGLPLLFHADRIRAAAIPEGDTDRVIEEILVTARRRDETPIAVPMTLTYIDGATLDGLQFHDLDEIMSLSPGVLVYGGGDGVSSQITIRGVVTPGASVEPGNAVYVDEVYVSGMYTILPGFYDIQSVQVLKGPQAGLYGRNTIGGAVVVTTGQPTDE